MRIESAAVYGELEQAKRGSRYGLTAVIAGMVVAGAAVLTGHSLEGLAVVMAELIGLGSVFIYGERQRRKERTDRAELMARQLPGRQK